MEYAIYVITALAAGVGMGLVGLSSATILTPVIIVLCPSFASEGGTYMAIGLALGTDVLSGALTAITYAKNGHIALKRARVMFICIVTMCIAGSIAASYVSNTVMGWFSVLLCLAIGIRFITKPGSGSEAHPERKTAQGGYALAVSLFFGLTIGFGIGFVGSGGGMMMVVVFTLFLGMARKDSVGTATFIMVFAGSIAFISHVLVAPSMLELHWDAMLICMPCATIAAAISARFANRVDDRVSGLIIGVVLSIVGVVLVFFRFFS